MAIASAELPGPITAASEGEASKPNMKFIGIKADNIDYQTRLAVRVIIRNDKDEIIILSAKKENYYKLPGGCIDGDEDHQTAVEREAMEVTGCKIRIAADCIAAVEEYRSDLHQISYCYYATLAEDTGVTALTTDEVADGLEHEWVLVERVVEKMKGCEPSTELGKSVRERNLFMLETWRNGKSSCLEQVDFSVYRETDLIKGYGW